MKFLHRMQFGMIAVTDVRTRNRSMAREVMTTNSDVTKGLEYDL